MSKTSYKDIPVGFHRVYKGPLDNSELVLNGDLGLNNYIIREASYSEQRLNVRYSNDQVYRIRLVDLHPTEDRIVLTPVVELPNFELVTRKVDGYYYGLVYYNNGGRAYSGKLNYGRLSDVRAWDILPLMSIISGTIDDSEIDYIFTINGDDHTFKSRNFLNNRIYEDAIGIHSEEDENYWYSSSYSVGIMPKNVMDVESMLWVRCDNYIKCLGGM